VSIWAPLPPSFWQYANELARYGMVGMGWLTQGKAGNPQALALGLAVLLLPGAILSVGLWLGVNALFHRAGIGGALLALKAREPNQSELKELQLADAVQEMAIAAGLPVPKIMLIDAPAANAAVIGTSPNDARIVVSRGLLEQLNRDELEGALAHLVASIGNGDLRIAFRVTSVFETCGLLVAIINAPFGRRSRGTLWRIVRYGLFGKKDSEGAAQEAVAMSALLTRSVGLDTDDIDDVFDSASRKKSIFRSVRTFLLFPIFLTNTAIKLSLWFFSFSMLGPSMALLWRKRKYLADACAVQLTRNPDGLAEALRKLNSERGPIPGGAWASHLFLVNPAGSDRVNDPKANAAQQQMWARMWAASEASKTSSPSVPADIQSVMRQITGKSVDEMPSLTDIAASQHGDAAALRRLREFDNTKTTTQPAASNSQESADSSNIAFAGFFPSLKRRLKCLDRMGAHVELESDGGKSWIVIAVLSVLLGPFALAALALLLLLIAILTMASLVFLTIWMAVIHQLFVVFLHH
jgi:Zn-dependent protease with chaperone function